jgi:hypothetical protein
MVRFFFFLFILLNFSYISSGQDTISIGFKDSKPIVFNRVDKDQILSIPLELEIDKSIKNLDNYNFDLTLKDSESNLNRNDYKLYFEKATLLETKSKTEIFFKLKKDYLGDRFRRLYYEINVTHKDTTKQLINSSEHKKLEVKINPYEQLLGYEYLAYVGTNFDLVDGIQAKDLFFAANIFNVPLNHKKRVGFYLSLYGNRAFTQIDSTAIERKTIDLTPIDDTSYSKSTTTNYIFSKQVTDNLGVYVSPLFKINYFNPNLEKRDLNLYYSPSLEFVYRRKTLTYGDTGRVLKDSIVINGNINDEELPTTTESPLFGQSLNEFSFNLGIVGLFMSLENKNISVRVHGSVGYASNYNIDDAGTNFLQDADVFFSGRAWITESTTGITLQAEVTNLLNEPRPFFVATLSKAFNFRDLGKIFQPITTR